MATNTNLAGSRQGTQPRSGPISVGLDTALAAALACVVLLPLLGHRALAMWDEGIYAEVAREILSGSWLTLHWNGQPWLEKPPLLFWLTAASFKLFGLGEFQARLPAAFSGIGTVALLHAWLAGWRSRASAWFSTVILLSTYGFLHICRVGETDAPLALAVLLALIGLSSADEGRRRGCWIFWVGCSLAVMIKGGAATPLFLTAALVLAIDWARLRRDVSTICAGACGFLLIVLPWHLAMLHHFGRAFLHEYLGFHVLQRAAFAIEGHYTHWWFYLFVLLVSAIPWCAVFPIAAWQALRRPDLRPLRILGIFAIIEIVFFSILRTRLPHYIAPAYPALAGLTGVYLGDKWGSLRSGQNAARARALFLLALAAIWAVTSLLTAPSRKHLHSPRLNGQLTPDNRETAALLKTFFAHPQQGLPSGPLLLWDESPIAPITTAAFYSRRPVQEVQIRPAPLGVPRDKYTFDPIPLAKAAGSNPRLILLDRSLRPSLPGNLRYSQLMISATLELGEVVSCH